MVFVEGSQGFYGPIRVLFGTPIYEISQQHCWHLPAFKVKTAVLMELLRLQQKNQLPSELLAEDMLKLIEEDSKNTVRVQMWEFEVEGYDQDVQPLLQLVWEVNNKMVSRDIEFEARRSLNSEPDKVHHVRFLSSAQRYAKILTEQFNKGPVFKESGPRDIVLDLVPRVLQGFWKPKPSTARIMPSKTLSHVVVGVAQAVLDKVSSALSSSPATVTITRAGEEEIVQAVLQEVRRLYTEDILKQKLRSFEATVLNTITEVAAKNICLLFQPQTRTEEPLHNDKPDEASPGQDHDSSAERTPHSQNTLPAVTTAPVSVPGGEDVEGQLSRESASVTAQPPPPPETKNQTPFTLDLDVPEEPAPVPDETSPGQDHDSSAGRTPCPQNTLPAVTSVGVSVPGGEDVEGQLSRESASVTDQPPTPPEPTSQSTPALDQDTSEEPAPVEDLSPSPADALPAGVTVNTPVLGGEDMNNTPPVTVKNKKKSRTRRFFSWLTKRLSCGVLPEDDD